ncbi:GTPase of the mitochondrial inner membrane that associates with the large ribosomal subunit [Dimargaris xerosporica]|nr:GTPase of the mitochondrial inner membrane that associates with the large ribosomal subunit [Dimargaris xerosporica]
MVHGGNFVDVKRIMVRGGKGGNGCVSFLREKYVDVGPPNGGNGGRGGSVRVCVDPQESTLNYIQSQYRAPAGTNGAGKSKHGANGDDCVLRVPPGTVIRELDPPSKPPTPASASSLSVPPQPVATTEDGNEVMVKGFRPWAAAVADEQAASSPQTQSPFVYYSDWEDLGETANVRIPPQFRPRRGSAVPAPKLSIDMLDVSQDSVVLAKGGLGGLGNPYFATSTNRSPKYALKGLLGEQRWFELELKTIADAGLVGLPNAGKSTFLRAVSNAHPKVAPYPFTTLNPYLGTIDYDDMAQLTLADIPGLIAGAHANHGLGHQFLRHVERSHVLVYVLDIGKPDPWNDLATLQRELQLYSADLLHKPALIVGNKADLTVPAKDNLTRLQTCTDIPIVPVSALYRKNIHKITYLLRDKVEAAKKQQKQRATLADDTSLTIEI